MNLMNYGAAKAAERQAAMFKVLSVSARVRIVHILKAGSCCVNALARSLEMTPAAVSQHLRVLRDAGLVVGEKRGYHVHYRVDKDALARWRAKAATFLDPDGKESGRP